MTTHKAKKNIRGYLLENGLSFDKLTGEVLHFDLLGKSVVFVTIHGWDSSQDASGVARFARSLRTREVDAVILFN